MIGDSDSVGIVRDRAAGNLEKRLHACRVMPHLDAVAVGNYKRAAAMIELRPRILAVRNSHGAVESPVAGVLLNRHVRTFAHAKLHFTSSLGRRPYLKVSRIVDK